MLAARPIVVPDGSLCLFDFDGTISFSDSFIPFCIYTFGYAKTLRALSQIALQYPTIVSYARHSQTLPETPPVHHAQPSADTSHLLAALCPQETSVKLRQRSIAKAVLIRALFKGARYDHVVQKAHGFCQQLYPQLRPQAIEFLNTLAHPNVTRTMVSASLELYLTPLAQKLHIPTVIATQLQVDTTGCFTGQFAAPNCIGVQKLLNVKAHYQEQLSHFSHIHVFGDSSGDHAMMSLADINGAHMHPFVPDLEPYAPFYG